MSKIFSYLAVEKLEGFRAAIEDVAVLVAELRDNCTEGEDTWGRLQNALMYLDAALEQLDPGSSIP